MFMLIVFRSKLVHYTPCQIFKYMNISLRHQMFVGNIFPEDIRKY